MKKFIFKCLLFIVLLIGVDFASGYLYRLNKYATTERLYKARHLAEDFSEDILFLGSSRTAHHYNSDLVSDSTGMSCFNAGFDGIGIINAYPFFKMAVEHHVPKVIVYDITPPVDYLENDNLQYTTYIKTYHKSPYVMEVVESISLLEKYKFYSNIYCLNSLIPQLLSLPLIRSSHRDSGFEPLYNVIEDRLAYYDDSREFSTMKLDSVKLKFLDKMITESKELGIDFYLALSPEFDNQLEHVEYAEYLSQKYDVPLFNHLYDEGFWRNRKYFTDRTHLNVCGADTLTTILIHEILKKSI